MGLLRNLFPGNAVSPEPSDEGDALLVTRARQGDAQAFALLYHRYCRAVYDYAYHRLGSREAAEDATQTIFLKAVAALPRTRDDTLFAGWLFAIARNVVIDEWRKPDGKSSTLDLAIDLADDGESLEERAERAAWASELARLREDCLSGYERDVLDLRLQGLNDIEIAVSLGRSHGAIRTLQYRMIAKLRECLGLTKEAAHA